MDGLQERARSRSTSTLPVSTTTGRLDRTHPPPRWLIDDLTAHYRPDDDLVPHRKAPDVGTAGLGYALHVSTGAHFMTMRGRQYGDANFQEEHVFKDVMAELIVERGITKVISIHGMKAGKFKDFGDERAYDVLLGTGPHPPPQSVRAAARIEAIAARFDLRIATNGWFVKVADDDPLTLEVNPDGTIAFNGFHAPDYTTRACAQRLAEENGMELAAVQVELSDLFRLLPQDVRRAKRKRLIGRAPTHAGAAAKRSNGYEPENGPRRPLSSICTGAGRRASPTLSARLNRWASMRLSYGRGLALGRL